MKLNIGIADRITRLLLAVVMIVLFYADVLSDIFGVIGLVAAFLLTATCLIGFCPVYKCLKINSIFNNKVE